MEIEGVGLTAANSTSLKRAPAPPGQSVTGDPTNFPFWPGIHVRYAVNMYLVSQRVHIHACLHITHTHTHTHTHTQVVLLSQSVKCYRKRPSMTSTLKAVRFCYTLDHYMYIHICYIVLDFLTVPPGFDEGVEFQVTEHSRDEHIAETKTEDKGLGLCVSA